MIVLSFPVLFKIAPNPECANIKTKQASHIFAPQLLVTRGEKVSDLKSADSPQINSAAHLNRSHSTPPAWKSAAEARSVKVLKVKVLSESESVELSLANSVTLGPEVGARINLIDVRSISLSIPISAPDANKITFRLT